VRRCSSTAATRIASSVRMPVDPVVRAMTGGFCHRIERLTV
jgi:hypothetical protein